MITSDKIFEIGDKIYPTDFSFFTVKNDKDFMDICYFKSDEIKDKLRKENPLVVISLPYRRNNDEEFLYKGYYFIDVKFEDSEEIYSIMNSKTNVFKNYWKYLEWIEDVEMCAAFGY